MDQTIFNICLGKTGFITNMFAPKQRFAIFRMTIY